MTEGTISETQEEVLGSNSDAPAAFSVHLANFEGPFDLLLQLISRHKMDVTEVALSVVTDDFIAYEMPKSAFSRFAQFAYDYDRLIYHTH